MGVFNLLSTKKKLIEVTHGACDDWHLDTDTLATMVRVSVQAQLRLFDDKRMRSYYFFPMIDERYSGELENELLAMIQRVQLDNRKDLEWWVETMIVNSYSQNIHIGLPNTLPEPLFMQDLLQWREVSYLRKRDAVYPVDYTTGTSYLRYSRRWEPNR